MRSEFGRSTIDEVVALIVDHRGITPKKLGGDFAPLGVQVISAKNVYSGRLHLDKNPRFVEPAMAHRWMPDKVRRGDVLLTSEAPLGQAAYVASDTSCCLGQRLFALRARPGVLHGRFLYYALTSPQVQRRLHARATGTTAQGIKQSELRQVEIELPDLEEQARIAAVLGTLDEKVDSNRRVATLLEDTAATVFRARFVDFVGVEQFEESEIGPIPEGWDVGTVGNLCDAVRNGGTPRRMEPRYWSGGTIPWFKTGELHGSFLPRQSAVSITETGLMESNCSLLPRGTILIAIYAAPTVGRLGILDTQGTCNQACTALMPKDDVGYPFVYLTLQRLRDYFNGLASGSAQQNISKRIVESAPALIPPIEALASFNALTLPQFEMLAALQRESEALSMLRDTLVAKLVSGQIRVPDDPERQQVIRPVDERLAGAKA